METPKAELRKNAPEIFKDHHTVKREEAHKIVAGATLVFLENALK